MAGTIALMAGEGWSSHTPSVIQRAERLRRVASDFPASDVFVRFEYHRIVVREGLDNSINKKRIAI